MLGFFQGDYKSGKEDQVEFLGLRVQTLNTKP